MHHHIVNIASFQVGNFIHCVSVCVHVTRQSIVHDRNFPQVGGRLWIVFAGFHTLR